MLSVAAKEAADSAARVITSKSGALPHWVMTNPPLSITNPTVASPLIKSSCKAAFSSPMSSSISWGSVGIPNDLGPGGSGDPALAFGDELLEQQAGDHVQRLEDAFALVGASREGRHLFLAVVQQVVHEFDGRRIGHIALVVLEHEGDVVELEVEGTKVFLEVLEALHVLLHLVVLRVSDEHDAVDAAQDELAGGVVDHLAGHRVELELGFESLDGHGLDGEKVEKQRAVGTGGQRNQLALVAGHSLHVIVNLHQVGRLPAHGGAVIDDFDLKFLAGLIDDRHR